MSADRVGFGLSWNKFRRWCAPSFGIVTFKYLTRFYQDGHPVPFARSYAMSFHYPFRSLHHVVANAAVAVIVALKN
ncbi:hypothetical protein NC77_17515 [Janthinobacterium lividum]|nr:hypothetical protein NC77_17515 [Janthinobacterium lividum]